MTEENAVGITPERLREVLDYDPETGEFIWRVSTRNRVRQGDRAGSLHISGYLCIQVDGRIYKGHRLAWVFMFGKWPDSDLDHIDCNRANNKIANLRLATRSQNNANAQRSRNNTSGFKGVHFHRRTRKWRAEISKGGGKRHLGLFPTAAEAHAAYCAAAQELHGEFWRAA